MDYYRTCARARRVVIRPPAGHARSARSRDRYSHPPEAAATFLSYIALTVSLSFPSATGAYSFRFRRQRFVWGVLSFIVPNYILLTRHRPSNDV